MRGSRALLVGAGALLASLLTALPASADWPTDSTTNVPLCTATGNQLYPVSTADGAGGSIVAWSDARGGFNHLYVQRVNADGAVQWAANGVSLTTVSYNQQNARIVSDAAGGAIVAWQDLRSGTYDVYAQHVLSSGTVDPAWPVDGRGVCTATGTQAYIVMTMDGTGGAILAWDDNRGGNYDMYAQHVSSAGVNQWTANGVALCTAAGTQYSGAIAPDGYGGAIVAWYDLRGGVDYDVYAQRINGGGVVQWAANGVAVCTASGNQESPIAMSDGAGGAILAWTDARLGADNVCVQRLNVSGVAQWTANGIMITEFTIWNSERPALCPDGAGGAILAWHSNREGDDDIWAQRMTATGATLWGNGGTLVALVPGGQLYPALVPDGFGGAVITWEDNRGADTDVYGQRIDASGLRVWNNTSVPICATTGRQAFLAVSADGAGGAIVSWQDARAGSSNYDIYSQRITRAGTGTAQPRIAWISNVPWDQGGRVRIKWIGSRLDTLPGLAIGTYGIWRQVTGDVAARALARGAHLAGAGDDVAVGPGIVRALPGATSTTWWEGVGAVPARGAAWYTFVAGTLQDSSAAGFGWTTFMVDARAAFSAGYWASSPDSGYSVDDLTPATPTAFTGEYAGGTSTLRWAPGTDPDLAGYRIHRGATPEFVPAAGNLVAQVAGTTCADAAGAPYWYKLAAVDVHGNLSGFVALLPSGTAGVDAGARDVLALGHAGPNPVTSAGIDVRFALPHAARAQLELLDVGGRRVLARDVGALGAGWHTVRLGEGADLAPGVYVVRLVQGTDERATRVVVMR